MSVDLREEAGGKVLEIKLSGTLTKEDYEHFVPEVDRLIRQHGKVRMLVQMHDFDGWSSGAWWQDLKFDLKHFSGLDRLALVGDRKWEPGTAPFCKPFTWGDVRYFNEDEASQASNWINEGIQSPHVLPHEEPGNRAEAGGQDDVKEGNVSVGSHYEDNSRMFHSQGERGH